MAWAIGRSFGLLPMLVAMTVFGATELYMFGTNWAGATLRHDWLALLAFAACALRRQRWALAGALLGFGTLLRVLPAVGLIGVAAPAVGWLAAQAWQRRRPTLSELLAQHRPAVRVLLAAAATMLATVLFTGVLYGFSAWSEWWSRITLYNRELAVNEVNLRMLVAGVDHLGGALMRERLPIYLLARRRRHRRGRAGRARSPARRGDAAGLAARARAAASRQLSGPLRLPARAAGRAPGPPRSGGAPAGRCAWAATGRSSIPTPRAGSS